jgi:hypothetical protein
MSDEIEDSQPDEIRRELIEAFVAAFPEAQREKERRKWEHHFRTMHLVAEAADGKRGFWWPDCAYGVQLYNVDPIEWAEVEKSGEAGARKFFDELTGLSAEEENLNQMILRLAEVGEDVSRIFAHATPSPAFFDKLAEAMREGNRRRVLPDQERMFQPRTMRDTASCLLNFFWHRGLRLKKIELPPFAFWTDQAIAEFFQNCIAFPADWQAIRDRRKFYGLRQPKLILVDRIEAERIGGEGEEIEIGEGFRLGYCRKLRPRTC